MTITTQLCLVSAQPTPNLTPASDRSMVPKRVILLVSPAMRQQAKWLGGVIASRGIKVEQWQIDDPFDIEAIQHSILSLLEREKALLETRAIALNATGGTKPMSIAAYEVFRSYELPIFYVHPEHDRVIWMVPGDRPSHNLEDRLKLEPFLQAHGVTVTETPARNIPDKAFLTCAREIVQSYDRCKKALPTLNWLAGRADRQNLTSDRVNNDHGALADLIDIFERHGFLRRSNGRLRFRDEASRFYANGGWLEYYVFDAVRKLRRSDTSIQDVARGLELERGQNNRKIPNELDVAFLRDNRLHIIECKTANLSRGREDGVGAEVIYKLDTLGDLFGGLQAQAMLVSFLPLPSHVTTRARDMNIAVCAGEQIKTLGEQIRRFTSANE